MRLFHISEEDSISIFMPRIPKRKDLKNRTPLVWAINEECLPNYLTPRNCPRVTYHCNEKTTLEDKKNFLSSDTITHVVAIEHKWFERMGNTNLFLYEFDPTDFYQQDRGAGYFVTEKPQTPINKIVIDDLFAELIKRNVEVRIIDNLWNLCEKIRKTSFDWSMCRMDFAEKKR
ncbi:hypothetical protein SAMN05518871_103300 [Psychrobacillus sp. OK028]|uniref:DUF6886 family protein n=1 Tax=Psychrobacillus sp. OK028 TaxID=1884359 RepID=UPI00087E2A22|nr:DUF6886 family protein [Psychrobacillus sp. OK028]SDN10316.1 hypothetical protein SAMN05518871_103300 [Psychrobacillus sp. OK028]